MLEVSWKWNWIWLDKGCVNALFAWMTFASQACTRFRAKMIITSVMTTSKDTFPASYPTNRSHLAHYALKHSTTLQWWTSSTYLDLDRSSIDSPMQPSCSPAHPTCSPAPPRTAPSTFPFPTDRARVMVSDAPPAPWTSAPSAASGTTMALAANSSLPPQQSGLIGARLAVTPSLCVVGVTSCGLTRSGRRRTADCARTASARSSAFGDARPCCAAWTPTAAVTSRPGKQLHPLGN